MNALKLPLLRKEYLSPTVNVLINSFKIFISLREIFSNSISFTVINNYRTGAGLHISIVFGTVYHVVY